MNYNTVYTAYLRLRLHIPLKRFTVTMCETTNAVYMDERVHTLSSNATCCSLADIVTTVTVLYKLYRVSELYNTRNNNIQ